MPKEAIRTEHAPQAVGAYSQAIRAGGFVFLSGQIPLDPQTGKLIDTDDIQAQTRRVMDNLSAVLRASGSTLEQVVKATIYLADIEDFKAVNTVYASYFPGPAPPARAAVQVAALPLGARVEIDAIALA